MAGLTRRVVAGILVLELISIVGYEMDEREAIVICKKALTMLGCATPDTQKSARNYAHLAIRALQLGGFDAHAATVWEVLNHADSCP